jgi:outer membrane lipoprotein-sorting protein
MKEMIFFIMFIPVMVLPGSANAQSLESILETHFNIVGQENLLSVESILTKGTLRQGGFEIELTSYIKRPNKYRLEGRYEGLTFVQVFDGEIGWTYNQMQGDSLPSLLADEELEILKSQADIDGLLFNYGNKGFEIELLEPESFENILTDVILLSNSKGFKIIYQLDSETGVIIKEKTIATIAGTERIYESTYTDYRYVNKILFPFSVDVYMGGELIMEIDYTSIELDAEIEDFIFATPQSLKENVDSY